MQEQIPRQENSAVKYIFPIGVDHSLSPVFDRLLKLLEKGDPVKSEVGVSDTTFEQKHTRYSI